MKRKPSYGNRGEELTSLFDANDILCRTSIIERDALILELLKRLAFNHGIGNVPRVMQAVLDREAAQPTVLGTGIAVPHARIEKLECPFIAIATSEKGIVFSPDYPPVQLVVLVLVPKENPASYLQILSSIAGLCTEEHTAESVSRLARTADVYDFFQGKGFALPQFVCAADIMASEPTTLSDTDSLKDAIDLFILQNVTDVPVVDGDGDLVGAVTANALLRVCLPDYLLWTEDLSPIINFEPFLSVLRNESSTSLSDIMTQEYASVQADQPAIAVAEELRRRQAGQCYVVRGDRLVGLITLPNFLQKILRE